MDLDALVSEVLSHQFAESQYTNYAKLKLNEAQQYVCAQTDFPEMLSAADIPLVAGTGGYNLPDDFSRLKIVSLLDAGNSRDSYTPLQSLSQTDFYALPDGTGTVTSYCITRLDVGVWPVPDTAGTMRVDYYRQPATLTLGTDEPEIPAAYHHLLVSYALIKCFERENDYDAAMYHQSRFDTEIMKCRGEVQYNTKHWGQPTLAGGMWANGGPSGPTVWNR